MEFKDLDLTKEYTYADLIVEILSKGTAEKDVKDKFQVYEESGVQEY